MPTFEDMADPSAPFGCRRAPYPSRLVNTASRKTSLHRDRPNRSVRLARSYPRTQTHTPRLPQQELAPGSWPGITRTIAASWAYPFFTMSRKPPLGTRRNRTLRRWTLILRKSGGARRDRTDDLLLAKQALSQLSYGPVSSHPFQAAIATGSRHPRLGGPGKI
jgi:hypothetical protein